MWNSALLELASNSVTLAFQLVSRRSNCIAFGGEDQKIAMASKSGNEVTVKVDPGRSRSKSRGRSQSRGRPKDVKITVNSKPKQKRRTRPRGRSGQRVAKIVKRQLDRAGVTGPRPSIGQKATATLGTVGANSTGAAELEMCLLLNPALVKDSTGSTQFGPVQALAAQYSLWRLKSASVKLTPLIGASAIAGTSIRISLNSTAVPSSTSWSGLGARKHRDVVVGRGGVFKLTARDLGGPREGWWLTNTNDSADATLGPSVEIHTLGKTTSTYKNEAYTGPIFLCEISAYWEFASFAANPALASLNKGQEQKASITFSGDVGQPLVMEAPPTSTFAMAVAHASNFSTFAAEEKKVSDTIFQIVNTGVEGVASVVPPPFGWLIKGGWWFVKKVTGLSTLYATPGKDHFYVYPSYEDALSNKPAICTGRVSPSQLYSADQPGTSHLFYTQMNAPSLGHNETGQSTYVLPQPPTPPTPTYDNEGWIIFNCATSYLLGTPFAAKNGTLRIGLKSKANGDIIKVPTVFCARINTPHCFLKSNENGDILGLISHNQLPPTAGINLVSQNGNTVYGTVHAYGSHIVATSGTAEQKKVKYDFYLVKVTTATASTEQTDAKNIYIEAGTNIMKFSERTGDTRLQLTDQVWYLFGNYKQVALGEQGPVYPDFSYNYPAPTLTGEMPVLGPALTWFSNTFSLKMRYGLPQAITPVQPAALFYSADPFKTGPEPEIGEPSDEEDVAEVEEEVESAEDSLTDVTDTDEETEYESDAGDDETVASRRLLLMNTMINQGIPEEQAARAAVRAFPTAAQQFEKNTFMVALADGFSPRQARADAKRAAAEFSSSRGHAE
uniref:Capsid polyprotein VP90 n=1 Tax=California sea lion astrovirus 6 TaxID=1073955 RepID=G1JYU3_9VIRU|nr:capsid precursor protein [California sea lion astrovirus 6]